MMAVYGLVGATIVIGFVFFVITGVILEQGPIGLARVWIIISGFVIFMWLLNRKTDSLIWWLYFFSGIAIFGAAVYLVLSVLS
jgi:hypothetical protein